MSKTSIIRTSPAKLIVILSIALLLVAVGAWWKLIFSNPTKVFERMLATNLSTASITKQVSEGDDSQSLEQKTQLVASGVQRVHSTSVLTQVADSDTAVTTESIASPTTDFVRYVDIKTSQKNVQGKSFDFSSIIGSWGKTDQNDPDGGSAQLFNQTVLGVVPVGNLPATQRKELITLIKNSGAYGFNSKDVRRDKVGGRPVYSYDVSVKPSAYVAVLKAFARNIGLKQLESVDPSDYAGSQPLTFVFDIDVWSGQLTKVSYKDSERSEKYSAYGALLQIDLPNTTASVSDLQTRLQQIR